jgi:putative transposase
VINRLGGAPKIREIIKRKYPEIKTPARNTIHCILDKNDLVIRRRNKRFKAQGTPLSTSFNPNDL